MYRLWKMNILNSSFFSLTVVVGLHGKIKEAAIGRLPLKGARLLFGGVIRIRSIRLDHSSRFVFAARDRDAVVIRCFLSTFAQRNLTDSNPT